jgi:competence protein ComEC
MLHIRLKQYTYPLPLLQLHFGCVTFVYLAASLWSIFSTEAAYVSTALLAVIWMLLNTKAKCWATIGIAGAILSAQYNKMPSIATGQIQTKATLQHIQITPPKAKWQRTRYKAHFKNPQGWLLVSIDSTQYLTLKTGMQYCIKGASSPPRSSVNSGSFNYKQYLERKKYFAVLPKNTIITQCPLQALPLRKKISNGLYAALQTAGDQSKQYLHQTYSNPTASVLQALYLGDRSELPSDFIEKFRTAGLVHILAISGFHVGLLAAVFLFGMRMMGLPLKLCMVAVTCLLFMYAPISGSGVSVLRAVAMAFFSYATAIWGKPGKSLNNLGIAGCILLVHDPLLLYDIGFQLSMSATAAIVYLQKANGVILQAIPLPHWVKKTLVTPLLITLWAFMGTAPFLIMHFQFLALAAFPGALVVVPLISLAMLSALLAAGASLLHLSFLATPWVNTTELLLQIGTQLTTHLAHFQSLQIHIAAKPMWQWMLWILFCLLIPDALTNKGFCRFNMMVLLAIASLHYPVTQIYKALHIQATIVQLDVGQGDALFMKLPGDIHIVIDAGDASPFFNHGQSTLMPFFKYHGIDTIHYLILTHSDKDHIGGAQHVLTHAPIQNIILPATSYELYPQRWEQILQAASPTTKIIPIRQGDGIYSAHWSLEFMAPRSGQNSTDYNEHSITAVLHVQNKAAALFTGDLTAKEELAILPHLLDKTNTIPILKVGHHGSRTSSQQQFIQKIQPQIALISAGFQNRFQHPHPEVLQTLQLAQSTIRNTAYCGSQTLVISSQKIQSKSAVKSQECAPVILDW